jgi:hypothetical protein
LSTREGRRNAVSLARYIYFYGIHLFFFLFASSAYLFFFKPEYLDVSNWVWALIIIMWSAYNSPLLPKVFGSELIVSYRESCVRRFGTFRNVSLIVSIPILLIGAVMFKELWSRWTYVELIKTITLDKSRESFPFATADELAEAFNLYPHRREVPFILARMSRLLAFDDETSNYNIYIARFYQKVNTKAVFARYRDRRVLERYDGAMDPIVYLSRMSVDARGADHQSLADAIGVLWKYRDADGLATFLRLIHEHEMYNREGNHNKLQETRETIKKLLDGIRRQESAQTHIEDITSHLFQELLDHYAQLHIETTSAETIAPGDRIKRTVQVYSRILAVRKLIANASEVPWLDGPGKFTLYQYFKHRVGRESNITTEVFKLFDTLPGLAEAMDQKIFNAEAFKEFRSLETWERGTPLSSTFSGKGMNERVMQWLRSGW